MMQILLISFFPLAIFKVRISVWKFATEINKTPQVSFLKTEVCKEALKAFELYLFYVLGKKT